MDHFRQVYAQQADAYHRMIASEDADGELLGALRSLMDWRGKRLLDLGTGTGRMPILLAKEGVRTVGIDLHEAMLRESDRQMVSMGMRWMLVQGDMQSLPCRSGCADAVIAGWSLGHSRAWHADTWQAHMGTMLREMHRVIAPGGWLVIFETLTTGATTPAPPTQDLGEYYDWLERDWGFTRRVLRTDYRFASVSEAVAATEFFFGTELSLRIRDNEWSRVPEWTGMWCRRDGAA